MEQIVLVTSYGANDPRAGFERNGNRSGQLFLVRECGYGRFFDRAPQIVEAGGEKTWIIRGAHAVVAITEVDEGTILSRLDNPDEYMLLCDHQVSATCQVGKDDTIECGPESVTILPPGPSSVICKNPGYAVRCFTTRATDIAALAQNADAYRHLAPECAPLIDWPSPPGGFKLRNYDLRQLQRTTFAHIIRSTNLMLSTPMRNSKRRDPRAMSPHHHNDFEQISITLEGNWVHHLRTAWVPDMTAWREDQHAVFASPSALVIPAGMIHTSQDVGPGECWLIDLFSPPREDFSRQQGWVLNAGDYPAAWERTA